jgi:hypothetical protein
MVTSDISPRHLSHALVMMTARYSHRMIALSVMIAVTAQ